MTSPTADDIAIPPPPVAMGARAEVRRSGSGRHWLLVGLEAIALLGGCLLFACTAAGILAADLFTR